MVKRTTTLIASPKQGETSLWLSGKESAFLARDPGDLGSVPGLGWSPGEGHGNPLQYFCLEHPMGRGAWQATQSMGSQRVGHNWSNLAHPHSSKKNGQLLLKTLELLNGFQGQVFKDSMREYHRVCDHLMNNCLIALLWGKWWWVRDFNQKTSGSN